MARLGIIFGLILVGISLAAMLQTPQKAPSQFYSMMFGIPTFFCGIVALNPHRRKQAMTVATLLCLAAILSGLTWIMIHYSKDFARSAMPSVSPAPPVIAMTITSTFVIVCSLIGFSKAKKKRLSKQTS